MKRIKINGTPTGRPKQRKIRFNWNPKRDLALLNALLEFRPWEFGDVVYQDVHKQLHFDVTIRQCKLRHRHLVKSYKEQDMAALRRSGTEEEYDQRDQLIQEVISLEEIAGAHLLVDLDAESAGADSDHTFSESEIDTVAVKEPPTGGKKSGKLQRSIAAKKLFAKKEGDLIRKEALDNSLEGNTATEPDAGRGKRVNFEKLCLNKTTVETRKLELDQELKSKELESKQTLEQKRIEMEERVAMKKLELEHDERERQREFLRTQQQREFELRESANSNMLKLLEMFSKK